MSRSRIAVVGSYATGLTMKVSRIPCAGETLIGAGYRVDFGGKGSNQAVGCARLGASVDFVAKVGKDNFAEMALQLYRDEGISVAHVKQTADAPTGVGFIVVEENSGQNSIVLDPGANELLSASDVSGAARVFKNALVVLTQLEIPVEAAAEALSQGKSAGALAILNPAPVRPLPADMFQRIDVITPNESEAKVLTGRSPSDNAEPQVIAQDLIRSGVKKVVITLGENGALLVEPDSSRHFPAIPVKAVDTTGAGDAFNAALATALSNGSAIDEAIQFAVIVGAMAVTKEGVIPSLPRQQEVLDFCRVHNAKTPQWLTATAK